MGLRWIAAAAVSCPVTVDDLQHLLIARLIRQVGGNTRRWRMAIGSVQLRDSATHSHCNWEVRPSGSMDEVAEIERLLDSIRLEHPIVVVG